MQGHTVVRHTKLSQNINGGVMIQHFLRIYLRFPLGTLLIVLCCVMQAIITFKAQVTTAADDIIIFYCYFQREYGLAFHVNRLPGRRFT